MPRSTPLIPAMNAGELSPNLHARLDFVKYPYGLETAVNVVLLAEGGVMRRAGSRYIAALKSSTVMGRVTKFQFSTTQAYVCEMCDYALRFYRYQGQITVADTDAAVSNGTFTSNITGWDDVSTGGAGNTISHDSTNGRLSLTPNGTAADDIGWAQQDITTTATNTEHVLKFQVIGAPGDKIEFQVGTSTGATDTLAAVEREVGYHCVAFTPTTSPFYIQFRNLGSNANKTLQIDNVSLIDNSAVEIDTPWPEADLYQVEGPQSADVRYFFHTSYPTHKLERYGHTTWSLVEVAWQDGPWLAENTTATTLTFSAATGLGVTVTASAVTGINDGDGFQSTDVGRLIRLTDNSTVNWGWAVITAITSTTVVTVDVKRTVAVTTAETRWRLGAWSGTTGYPSSATFYEQRLFAANNSNQPQTFWASQTADFETHSPDSANSSSVWNETVQDDDALDYTISADDVNAIRWLSAGANTLAIGTTGGTWVPSSTGAVLTPSDISVRRQTTRPAAAIQPVRVDNFVLFVQRALRKLREFGYVFETDSYQAPDMTRLASHISYGGISGLEWAEEPGSLVWGWRADGQALSMTYRREEDVVGWGRHILGGGLYTSITRVWQVDDSTPTYVDETTDANSSSNGDWTVFPSSAVANDYVAIGFTDTFDRVFFDYANGTAGVGGVVTWEYWDGDNWTALSGVTDNTSGFTATAADTLSVLWTVPGDWDKRVISSGKSLYYVRAKITTAYTTEPVLDQGYIMGPPVVESITVIPGADGSGQTQSSANRDEAWLIVKRTIDGSTKRFIELFERDFEDGHDQEDAYYADSLITYDGSSTTSITGLDHLEGEKVKVWADGYYAGDFTVSSGGITLTTAASVVQVGLGYYHMIKSLKIQPGTASGTSLGKTKKVLAITLSLHNAAVLNYGPDIANLTKLDFRDVSDPADTAVDLFTGEETFEIDDDWGPDPRFIIKDDTPAPFTLRAMAPITDVKELV